MVSGDIVYENKKPTEKYPGRISRRN